MKKTFLILAVLLISLPGFSQFGIKAGVETTTVPTYNFATGDNNITALDDASWGWHAGLFFRIKLGPVYLQPEAVFASTSFDYNVKTATTESVLAQKFNRLSVPILVGINLGPIRVNAGPAASVMIGSPEALISDPDFEDMYKGAVWGYQAGVGIDLFKRLALDLRYAGGLGEQFGESVQIGSQNFKLDYGQTSFMMSVGLMF